MSDPLGSELPLGKYYVLVPGMSACNKCGGVRVATFSVTSAGFSCGDGFKHAENCSMFRCPHGLLWEELCEKCEAVEELNCHGDCD